MYFFQLNQKLDKVIKVYLKNNNKWTNLNDESGNRYVF